ncbi:MAG TPA: FtsW/RodA/SpoVE family cell cycle protein [Actinomycetota bacterium]|nr:FtsW/RodA/SpoVE family cell cycle protein [Actinomycetota bacterium]
MISPRTRRHNEVSLLLLAFFVAIGGVWLTALARGLQLPRNLFTYIVTFALSMVAAHLAIRRWAPGADPLLIAIPALLYAIGLVVIDRLAESIDQADLGVAQARWLVVAVGAMIATIALVRDARSLARFRYTFAFVGVVLLLLPLLPGIGREINGARLWIHLGPLSFQPAELGKIALVLFFAGYLAERRELLAVAKRRIGPIGVPAMRHFGPVLVAWGVSLLVMINQKDLGSSLLFFAIFVGMLWMATARPIYLVSGGLMFIAGALIAAKLFSHVESRILVWRDPFAHYDGRGYQVVQSLFALATGGTWGTGLGQGRPDLIRFSVHTDFIFSAIGEELGLAGGLSVLVAFALLAARGFGLSTRCRDDFSKLLVAGLIGALSLQTILIIGGVTKLIPLTGVTLPFVSYGGSSLLSNFILIGILIRVSDEVSKQQGEGPATELNLAAGGGR